MVGATAGAIMAGVILAVTMAVVPQVQDNAARQSLRAFQAANAAAYAADGIWRDAAGLIGRGYLPASAGAVRSAHGDGCYVAATTSATGAVFYATSRAPGGQPRNRQHRYHLVRARPGGREWLALGPRRTAAHLERRHSES